MQFTLIGNPENRRCEYFVTAVKSQGFKTPFVVPYLNILNKKVDLDAILSKSDYLRIDSPGENFEVTRQFLALANQHPNFEKEQAPTITAKEALILPFEKGRIQFLRQTHLGFLTLLNQIEKSLDLHPNIKAINSIKSIQLMFDKITCHQHFKEHNIKIVPAIYTVKSYEDLRLKMKEKAWTRVFIKPIHGSSASGVIAYRFSGDKEQAITSVELVRSKQETKIFNALKIHQYSKNKDIKYLIDTLTKEGVIVEKWIPKASLDTGVFDLRMVVIGGQAQHTVVRQSQSPMTNLHLGNQRGNLNLLKETIGTQKWESLCTLAEQAAQSIPDTTYLGLDVILSNNLKNNYILEANAFGDLLPNVLTNNMNTYEATVSYLNQKHA